MGLTEHEKADQLTSVPLFTTIGRAELNHVAQLSAERSVDVGEVLVQEVCCSNTPRSR